jgi:hypothetical protein
MYCATLHNSAVESRTSISAPNLAKVAIRVAIDSLEMLESRIKQVMRSLLQNE